MIAIHNYNDLVKQRTALLEKKEWYYAKYYSRIDTEVTEMITDEDAAAWSEVCAGLEWVTGLIEG